MLVHSVYFWLDPKLSAKNHKIFLQRLNDLMDIPSVKWGFIGTPADTDRPIIDRTYTYKLITAFDDVKGHDEYQVHPLHDAFRELSKMWIKVVIYDAVTLPGSRVAIGQAGGSSAPPRPVKNSGRSAKGSKKKGK